jgi:hypothetical protein
MKKKVTYFVVAMIVVISTVGFTNSESLISLLDYSTTKIIINDEVFLPVNQIGEEIKPLKLNGEVFLPVVQVLKIVDGTGEYNSSTDVLSIELKEPELRTAIGSTYTKDLGYKSNNNNMIYSGTKCQLFGRSYSNAITTIEPKHGLYRTNYDFDLTQNYSEIRGEVYSVDEPIVISVSDDKQDIDYGFISAEAGVPTQFAINIEGAKGIDFLVKTAHKHFVIGNIVLVE